LSLFCSSIDILCPPRPLLVIYGEEKIFNAPVRDRILSTYCVMLLLPAEGNLLVRP